MKEQIISFETAILAKKKGFKGEVNYFYELDTLDNNQLLKLPIIPHDHQQEVFQAPTQSLVQKWLREVHNIFVDIHVTNYAWNGKFSYFRTVRHIKDKYDDKYHSYRIREVSTYEEALEIGLQEALTLIIK